MNLFGEKDDPPPPPKKPLAPISSHAHDCEKCGVRPGRRHLPGCSAETCGECGGQYISCNCALNRRSSPDRRRRVRWQGEWSGSIEARELGMFVRWDSSLPRLNWVPCDPAAPGAMPDMGGIMEICRWDRETQLWVLRETESK